VVRVKKRDGKMELRALTYFAFYPKATAMDLDEMFGDG
jgi:homospermidine synthase